MTLRMNHRSVNPNAFKSLLALEQSAKNSGLDHKLYELIKLRASQVNGCSYCVDMHAKDLLSMGKAPIGCFSSQCGGKYRSIPRLSAPFWS